MILFGDINKDRDLGGGVLIDDIDILFLFIGGLGFGFFFLFFLCWLSSRVCGFIFDKKEVIYKVKKEL